MAQSLHRRGARPASSEARRTVNDTVELTSSCIRIRREGHEAITRALSKFREEPFADVLDALYGVDQYAALAMNDAGDITALERVPEDDSFTGSPVWDAIAPWVDPGDTLDYYETYIPYAYRVVFDGAGDWVREEVELDDEEDDEDLV